MSAAIQEQAAQAATKRKWPWVSWGNWYILRGVTENGWPSIYACLREYGDFQAQHRILIRDMPPDLRRVDIAVSLLPPLLRDAIVLWYQCDRDIRGRVIAPHAKALALRMPVSLYEESVRVGKHMAERGMEDRPRVELELAKRLRYSEA